MRWLQVPIVLSACAAGRDAPPSAPPVEHARPAASACTIRVDTQRGELAIDGVALPDLEPETLRRVLGAPDRVEKVERTSHYEESGAEPGDPWTSTPVQVTDFHHVYDARGLVFSTRNGAFSDADRPELLRVFFANPRQFDHTEAPPVLPATRGGCGIELDGVLVDPDVDARPPGVDHRTDHFSLWGVAFGPTSFATTIDAVYTTDSAVHVMVYLDGPTTGRPSYAELVLRR